MRDETIGAIAASLPGADRVFREFGLNFCCEGKLLLAEAAARRALSVEEIEHRLTVCRTVERFSKGTAEQDTGPLIQHIVQRYHRAHRLGFPELARLSRHVEAVHAAHASVPCGLAVTLENAFEALDEHMHDEEQTLFPAMLRRRHGPFVPDLIAVLTHEHLGVGSLLQRLRFMTNAFTPPPDACRSWRLLYSGLAALVDDLQDHVHLENNVLFPRFVAV
ncbi:DUF542 domain-containing protein [Aquisalimonas lutea]|uniref:DUF542 domain-containing protein n=1 Tax=Aquisalimonas lutea TaxID=1327750 RepID=UPI0025B3D6A3|nr:DUF542 domain-containing protein [Aquisalimonas lutea]MDN3519759.1 DUF542 domain-containing protein [Aquisalimonas lutea]